eukprot:CAMPEP_0118933136 /NCGR_PEP_ID=MMETSP1169-20130426/11388_1 /TAXON_ID=36882 /ORGANISM="Pyramimonas obovata, Strain CCMP722" /LENGTH=250 /DNA_ID=CAMNT_0006875863 /DNA_START=53 /DNA_END=805 /DNA_ORIENTATION=+
MNTATPCALRTAGVARQSGQTALMRGTPVKPAQTARIQARVSKGVYAAVELPKEYNAVKPVADRLFVKMPPADEFSVGGILLPSMSNDSKPTKGTVVALGPGKQGEKGVVPIGLSVGDTVTYSKYAGTEVEVGGEAHILLKEEDCIGTLAGADIASLKPLGDRVLIKCSEVEEETTGGVILAAGAKEKPLTGTVVAVGPGKVGEDGEMMAPDLAVGSEVMYSKYTGTEFEADDETNYIVVREADVLATLS